MDIYSDEQCLQYGKFMHTVERPTAEALYWSFFALVLVLLFSASWRFGRVMERIEPMRLGDPERQRRIKSCYYLSLLTGVLSLVITILECFVLLALQFCDGEPLSSLYWSTWTVLQVGAVVAILGISLHTRHMLRGRRHPPWALALGTPVLVVAGLGHYLQGKFRRGAKKAIARSRSQSRGRRRATDEPLSEAPTVRGDSPDSVDRENTVAGDTTDEDNRTVYGDSSDKFNAKIIGYTKQGDVIIRISPELSQELSKTKTASSIKWDEPMTPPVPRIDVEKFDADEVEYGMPRTGRSRHRSSSSITFKGKERVPTLEQQRRNFGLNSSSNFSTEPPVEYMSEKSEMMDSRAPSRLRPTYEGMRQLSPVPPFSPIDVRRPESRARDEAATKETKE